MPPTPEQLQINESAQLTPQQPQVTAVPDRPNYVEEGIVSMPSPQMWMGGIDPGDNWWNLGSNAAKAGMDIYKSVNDGLLASRRQNAENDMNNLQNISLEKPESPDMTPYQLKEWQQGQQRKLNNATYNSLVNQGLSDEDARGVLDGTKNPAGFKMYASDIQNILHLTRYQGQTNASMVNDIQRYDNIAFENSTTNFQHSNNNQWNASNSTLDQVIKNYKNTTDDLFYTSGLTQEQINNPDTSKLSKLQQDRHHIINYLINTSNYDKSIKQALTRQTTEFSKSFGKTQKQLAISNFSGIISDEDYINKSFDSYEKLMNDNKTISKLMQSSHTVDSQAVIDDISKQKLQENPSLTVGIAVNQTQSLNVEIGKLQEILTQPNISYQESIILKDEISKRVIKQNKIADEIVTHLSGVDLSPTMKAYYDNFNSMVGKNKQALALQNLQKINSKAASDVQLIVSGMDREIENNFDMLLQFRQHTKRTMTQPEFLQMYQTTEEKLPPTVKLLYNILPANQDTNSPLNSVEDKNLKPLIHTMIRNQVADQFGLTRRDNAIIPTNEIESELTKILVQGKIGSNTNASSVEAAVSVTNNDGQTRSELNKKKEIESIGNRLSTNSPGVTPENIREAAPAAMEDLLTQKAFTRGSVEILMAADGRKDTEMVAVMRQTPQNLEAAMSLFIEHPEYFDRAKIMEANRKRSLLLKTTTSATPGVNLESVEFMRDFQNFALTKMATADGNSYIAEAKQDPKIMAAEFTTMMSRKEKAQAALLTNVRNAVATNGGTTSDISGSVSSYFSGHSALTAASFTDMLYNSPMGADAAFPIYKEYIKNVLGDSYEGWGIWMSDNDLGHNTETMIKLSQAGDDDIFGPILTALWSADATSTPQSVLYEAQQMHQLGGHSFKKRIDINGTQRFVASTDLQNLTTVEGTNAAIPGYNIDPVVNPVQLMGQTYDSIVIGQLQNGLKKDGLPYVPSDFTEQQKYTPNKEDYKDIARSFFNGSVTKANLESDTSSMLVIDGLTEAFNGPSTPESRLALLKDPNSKLSKWVDLTAGTSGTNEIKNSKERWLSRVLAQPYLTGKSAVEIGLNSRSWIGFEKAGNMSTQIEARFRSLDEFQGTWATESQHKENLGPQLGDTSTRTKDGISFIDPSRGTEVIPTHPLTGAEMRMPQSYSAKFKAAANPEAYSKLSKNWVNENRGATWKFWDLDAHKFIETQVGSSNAFDYKLTSQNGMISGSKYQDRYNIQHFNLLPIQMIKPAPYIPIIRTNDFNGKPVAPAPLAPTADNFVGPPAPVASAPVAPAPVEPTQIEPTSPHPITPLIINNKANTQIDEPKPVTPATVSPGAVSGKGEDNDLVETMISDLSVKEGFVDTKRIDPTQKIDEKTGKPVVQYNIGYGVMLGKDSNEAFKSIGKTKEEIDGINNGTVKITKADAQDLSRYILKKRYIPTITKLVTPEIWNEMPEYLKKELISEEYRSMISQSTNTTKLIRERKFGEAAKEYLNSKEYTRVEKGGVGARYRLLSDALLKYQAELDLIAKNKKDNNKNG